MVAKLTINENTKYQNIKLLENEENFALYLDGDIQFFSHDEYRYHESLVHPAMTDHKYPRDVLILGGGDGLAVREVLKHKTVESITLVDIDEQLVKLCKESEKISKLNEKSLESDKLTIHTQDAKVWLKDNKKQFDVIIVDFPDPVSDEVSELYTVGMFELIKDNLKDDGIGCIQSGEVYKMPDAFWCIINTGLEAGLFMLPYHTNVPSFGEWGFSLFGKGFVKVPFKYDDKLKLKSITSQSASAMPVFPPDYYARHVETNTKENNILRKYYLEEKYRGFPDEIR